MIRDFMYGNHAEGYGNYDLRVGLDYAQGLMDEGHKTEPFHHYSLRAFQAWARRRLRDLKNRP